MKLRILVALYLGILLFSGIAHASEGLLVTSPSDWIVADEVLDGQRAEFFGGNVASGALILSPGWQWVQGFIYPNCSGSSCAIPADCTTSAPTCMTPTVPGSVWAIFLINENNVTICPMTGGTGSCTGLPGVTGGGGAWSLCPGSECHLYNATIDGNVDGAYNLGGTTGTTGGITVNLSGASGAYFAFYFVELLPPSSYVASYDKGGTAFTLTSATSYPAVALSVSGNTDAIVQISAAAVDAANFQSWSGSYITDTQSDGICLNCTSGAAPTFTGSGTPGPAEFVAMAFKSSANIFTVPVPTFSLVNYTPTFVSGGAHKNCSPTCAITIPSTGTGHLLLLVYGNQSGPAALSSISGGGTWVIPSGAVTCNAASSGSLSFGCGYVLSSSSGTTSIVVTLGTNSTTANFAIYEVSRTSGSFVLDSQNAATHTQTCSVVGLAPTITGTSDVVFQEIWASGGINTIQYYSMPYGFDIHLHWGESDGTFSGALLMNTTNANVPAVAFPVNCSGIGTAAMMLAFK